MTGSKTIGLIEMDWDYEFYASIELKQYYLTRYYVANGDARVVIDGCDEKYIWGSFSGTLLTDLRDGTQTAPIYDTIEVSGSYVIMKDWYGF